MEWRHVAASPIDSREIGGNFMARRAFVGLIWCVVLYFGLGYVVGVVAANGAAAHAEAGQDPQKVGAEAGEAAVESWRQLIMLAVVGFVFLGSRFGLLPGTRADQPLLVRR
jgi:hypothetical protein